jgi:hypothetical protein
MQRLISHVHVLVYDTTTVLTDLHSQKLITVNGMHDPHHAQTATK